MHMNAGKHKYNEKKYTYYILSVILKHDKIIKTFFLSIMYNKLQNTSLYVELVFNCLSFYSWPGAFTILIKYDIYTA